jgi:hypothetical protein
VTVALRPLFVAFIDLGSEILLLSPSKTYLLIFLLFKSAISLVNTMPCTKNKSKEILGFMLDMEMLALSKAFSLLFAFARGLPFCNPDPTSHGRIPARRQPPPDGDKDRRRRRTTKQLKQNRLGLTRFTFCFCN